MGALSSLTKWIPEDDLLLKNAVEAGASLESLAKGAVRFSRRFTIKELQDRWQSLLYDLDTSAEASARIIEIEIELAVPNHPKANRTFNLKGKESPSGKRKGESVRSQYYAMRKRILSEPFSYTDPGFPLPPNTHAGTGSESGCGAHFEPLPVDDYAIQEPILNDFGHMESSCGSGLHVFPEDMRFDSAAVGGGNLVHPSFHTDYMGAIEGELPNEMGDTHCLYGHRNVSSAAFDGAGHNSEDQSFDHNFVSEDFPDTIGENITSPKTLDVCDTKPHKSFSTSNLCENEGIVTTGNDNLCSQVQNCNGSVQEPGCSPLPPDLPVWETDENILTPTMPLEGHFEEKDHGMLDMDDIKKMDTPGCNVASAEPKLNDENETCSAAVNNQPIISETDFMDFSTSYMDFTDDDQLLFIDVDEKDISDKSCLPGLNSILLSPKDRHQHVVDNSSNPGATEVLDTSHVIPAAHSGESDDHCDQMHSSPDIDHGSTFSGTDLLSTSSRASPTAAPLLESMICVLNTEDSEIPCNDDVIFPTQTSSTFCTANLEKNSRENSSLVCDKILSNDGRTVDRVLTMKEEKVTTIPSNLSSSTEGASVLPRVDLLQSSDGCVVEAKASDGDPVAGFSIHANTSVYDPNSCTSATVASKSAPGAEVKEERDDVGLADSYKPDTNIHATLQKCLTSQLDVVTAEMGFSDPSAILPTSDHDEQLSDSDHEIPNFSDIEAMILDMDLGPYDQETCLFSREVSRFQCGDAKKTIARLEQGAHSYMNRAISSHGAFAVFYGRHLKYFIKSPEVSLGRATEDVKVDIDLGREGRANKISRRQAIIKMDEDGSFFLKNIGKHPVFVNSKEVPAKKRINLHSDSLVEIKDMTFIFEVNESAVRHYITTLRASSQEQYSRFDWIPNQNL